MSESQTLTTKPFTLDEATAFVMENKFDIPNHMLTADFMPQTTDMHCIDDRHTKDEATLAVPGAGIGVLTTILTALEKTEAKIGRKISYAPESICHAFEYIVGVPTYHSDEAAEAKPNSHVCEGCGHCNGALVNPEKYHLSNEMRDFLKTYIDKLPGRGPEPRIYKGSHNSRGVFIIDDFSISIEAQSKNGESQAYIYNRAWHRRTVKRLAAEIYFRALRKIAPEMTLDIFQGFIVPETAEIQLGQTVGHLASALPKFLVSRDQHNKIVVFQL